MPLGKPINRYLLEEYYISSKQLKYLIFFGIGIIIYTSSYVIKGNVHVSLKIGELLQFAGFAIFLLAAIFLTRFKIRASYLKFFFIIYCAWSLSVIGRGIHLDYTSVKYMLLNADYGILFYFVPLIILIPFDLIFLKKLFDAIIILGILYLICDVLFIKQLLDRSLATQNVVEYIVRNLGMPCGFLLLTYTYHSNKRRTLALMVMILSLLFTVYKARRGLSITLISILIPAYFLFVFYTKKKVLVIYLSALFIVLGAFYTTSIYQIHNNKLLSMIADRGSDDTRTGVELYFYDDMKPKDWIIGRGINGEYFCPDISEDQLTNYRDLIETGYLQIILKGGLIRLILFLLIAIPAFVLGLFYSKNILSKASAVWIVVALISLYPATVESFSLQYLLVWISIGICYSKEIRNISDQRIKDFFEQTYLRS